MSEEDTGGTAPRRRTPDGSKKRSSTPPPGRPSLREVQRGLTRTRLAEAAVAVIATNGYVAATVEDIASTAGAGRATFYLHFDGKLAALQHAGRPLDSWARDTLSMIDVDTELPRAAVRTMVEEGFRQWRENADLLSALLQAEAAEPALAADALAQLQAVVESSFPRYLARVDDDLRPVVRAELVMLVALLYRYMRYEFVTRPYPTDMTVQIEAMTNIIWQTMSTRLDESAR